LTATFRQTFQSRMLCPLHARYRVLSSIINCDSRAIACTTGCGVMDYRIWNYRRLEIRPISLERFTSSGCVISKVFSRHHAAVRWAEWFRCRGVFQKRRVCDRDAEDISSDEAHLPVISGTVNEQTFRCWAAENPRTIHQRPLRSPKVTTVRCALSSACVVGRYFFLKRVASPLPWLSTGTARCRRTFYARKWNLRSNTDAFRFQQDEATARHSRAILQEMFHGRLISLRKDVAWPPRSP